MQNLIFAGVAGYCMALGTVGAEVNQASMLESFLGWEKAVVIRGGDCKTVILPTPGGRIISQAINGDSMLWIDTNQLGRTQFDAAETTPLGGCQIEAYHAKGLLPEMPQLLACAWTWQALSPTAVSLQTPASVAPGLQMETVMVADPDSGEIGLRQKTKNTSDNTRPCGLRSRSYLKGGGFAILPLGSKGRFKAGWALGHAGENGSVDWDGDKPSDPRVRVARGLLLVRTDGRPLRVAVDQGPGWAIYTAGQLSLTKFFASDRKGHDGGVAIEFASSGARVEMVVSTPEQDLKAGESNELIESWILSDLQRSVVSFDEARDLAKRLPPSPFAKRKN